MSDKNSEKTGLLQPLPEVKDLIKIDCDLITVFKDFSETKSPNYISADKMLDRIKNCGVKQQIDEIRAEKNKKRRSALKKKLPCILWSGKFTQRSDKHITQHSGLVILDFDHVPNVEELKKVVSAHPFVYAAFISPSGDGLKVLVKIPAEPENHRSYYRGLMKIFPAIDPTSINESRICYESVDPEIYINTNAVVFANHVEERKQPKELKPDLNSCNYNDYSKANIALDIVRKAKDGEKHNELLKASNLMGGFGAGGVINEKEAVRLLEQEISNKDIDDFVAAQKTIQAGIQNGKNSPITNDESNKTESKFTKVKKYLTARYELLYNNVANDIEFKIKGTDGKFQVLNESNFYIELQEKNYRISQADLGALFRSDFVPVHNPIKEYFDKLGVWDKNVDVISKLCKYVTVKDHERFKRNFIKHLVRCVACGLGFNFNKQAFIFTGGQNAGKTTFVRFLCPESLKSYYAENISADKDGQIALTENFIINIDELAALAKMEINALKSMLSRATVKQRKPFDKKPSIAPRRANFFGSTNKDEFLSDETGSVRWICFEVQKIDFNYSKNINIDDVWRQAHGLFMEGFKYDLTPGEIEENEKANSFHQQTTVEIELLQEHFEIGNKDNGDPIVQPSKILSDLKFNYPTLSGNINPITLGRAFTYLGYKKYSIRDDLKKPIQGYCVKIIKSLTTLNTNL